MDYNALSTADKAMLEKRINLVMTQQSMEIMLNTTEHCFKTCVKTFRSNKLDSTETDCLSRCGQRYIETTQRVHARFQETQEIQMNDANIVIKTRTTVPREFADNRIQLEVIKYFLELTTMRLLTHNLIMCNVPSCRETVEADNTGLPESDKKMNYPLQIVVNEGGMEERNEECDGEFIKNMLKRIDWKALKSGATDLNYQIPENMPDSLNEEVLAEISHVLAEIEVMEGKLVCRHCSREYVINQGIPNMLLREDEV